MRPVALLAAVAALAVAGCGDDEPSGVDLPETVTAPPLEPDTGTLPEPTTTATTTQTTTTTSPDPDPPGTGGAAPAPAATTPAPAPAAPPTTTPRGTGGVSPGGEDGEGGAGDEDPTTSPGGVPAP